MSIIILAKFLTFFSQIMTVILFVELYGLYSSFKHSKRLFGNLYTNYLLLSDLLKKNKKVFTFKKLLNIKKNIKILFSYININSIFIIVFSLLFLDSLTITESDSEIHHYILKDNGELEEVTNAQEKERIERENKLSEENKLREENINSDIIIIILILLFGLFWFYFINPSNFFDNLFPPADSTDSTDPTDSGNSNVSFQNEKQTQYVYSTREKYPPYYPEVLEDYEKYLKSDEELKEIQQAYNEVAPEYCTAKFLKMNAFEECYEAEQAYKATLINLEGQAEYLIKKNYPNNLTCDEIDNIKQAYFDEHKDLVKSLRKTLREKEKALQEANHIYFLMTKKAGPLEDNVRRAEYARSIFQEIQLKNLKK